MKNRIKIPLTCLLAIALVLGGGLFLPVHIAPEPAQAAVSDKEVDNCDPTATVGRCADKCPAPTAEGAYNQLGTDPTTGAAICHFVYSNACPYSEAVSATDPMCYKNQPAGTAPTTTPAVVNQCGGK